MDKLPSILPPPLDYRKNIPLYYPKTEAEFKADSYEIYNPNVIRSCRNFYQGNYGSKLLSEVNHHLKSVQAKTIVELGCGSGYLLGNIAEGNPSAECVGLDYSYQMLKVAAQVFKSNSDVTALTALQNGMDDMEIPNQHLENVTFALSDACLTPFLDNSIDFCFSCFLWDRVGDPQKLLEEKIRIVKPGGTMMIISPFNYLAAKSWKEWYPIDQVVEKMEAHGLKLLYQNRFNLEELLDFRNNRVVWEVESLVFAR